MKVNELNPGIKLEIELLEDLESPKLKLLYISEFEMAEGNDCIYIAAPISEGKYLTARVGIGMFVYFNFNNEFYKFKAVLKERLIKGNIPLYKLNLVGEIERIQRRQFFRFDCVLDIRCREVEVSDEKVIPKGNFLNGLTRDISGGGTCIALIDGFEKGKLIECEIRLSEQQIIKFLGLVVRSIKTKGECRNNFEAGVEFFKIDNKTRESIISFIFQEQRKLRKKGMI